MAQLKANEVDAFLRKPAGYTVYLVYGPDHGLVTERGRRLAAASGVALDDPFSAIRLDADGFAADPERLLNEAYTVAMFGGDRLIWLRGVGNDRALTAQLDTLLADPPPRTTVVIEAGDLKKGAGLRTTVERAGAGLALPCYADNERGIQRLVDETFEAAGRRLELDARQFLVGHLGGDRRATRNELEKVLLYTEGQPAVTLDDVRAISGDASALAYDDVSDAVLAGDLPGFDRAMTKFDGAGGAPSVLFAVLIRQFQLLDRLRHDMHAHNKSAAAVVASARPPVFFARRKLIETALQRWPPQAIRAALQRLQDAVLQARRSRNLERNILHITLMALAIQSARRR
ncbi:MULTISPECIES: DNA polymerase III subunit delta [unclassified Roseitalea]|uniref:DNA polymerase III subunit delta n=1 Tax=unclassified Roseitalea TaxID=2639107 RepID=UPI00273E785E|nr:MULTISPECIES: DNA polymerase III subunit delta [unclassified Roseitalea]